MVEPAKKLSVKKMSAIATLVMVIVFGSMFYIYLEGTRLGDKHEPLLLAAMDIRLQTTLAHLRFEGLGNRDPDDGIDSIWKHLDQAEWYAQAMLKGGQHNQTVYLATEDPLLRGTIHDIATGLSKLRQVVLQWDSGKSTASAFSPKQHFDLIYAVLMQDTNTVESRLQQKIQAELQRSQQMQVALFLFSLLVGVFIIITLGRYIRRINDNIEELQAAYEELEHSNRDLASFAYIASHDLREPLRKIQAFGDRLVSKESDNLSPRGQDYIVRMQKAAARMKDLIEALLNYSRIGTKGEPFSRIDLNSIMQEVLGDLEYSINEVAASINVADLPVIEADKTQIRQVFQNLIANALKFRRPGVSPVIHITASVDQGLLTLRVTDNGIGFEAEYAERIFGVFQRLHGRDAYQGTGIGLSICQKTAERHGGTITAAGRPHEGATFTLTLPVKQKGEI